MQFASLERRTSAGGKDSVDHGRNSHDDLCNAVAGALTLISDARQPINISPAIMARVHRNREMSKRFAASGVDRRSYRTPVFFQ
jgi:hypothetical protein